jgi:osmoprotectant transport system permease protein
MGAYLEFWSEHAEKFLDPLAEHLQIVGVTLLISVALAAVVSVALLRHPRAKGVVLQLLSAVYAIPSLALFAVLIPVTGLGEGTAVLVLVAYNQYLLVRNIVTGIDGVDPSIVEAARGMGMSDARILREVQVPLALPLIMAGLRLAVISTIGIATIAATINAGGLGTVLFDGLRTLNSYKIVGGTLECALLAIVANAALRLLESAVTRRVVR